MAEVKRIYVEKKEDYAVAAKDLKKEIREYLGIKDLEQVRVLNRYDVEVKDSLILHFPMRMDFTSVPCSAIPAS